MPDVLIPNLDDVNKTAFCIPFNPDGMSLVLAERLPPSSFTDRDLENGCELRFQAYKVAWKKCLDRVQEIIHELQSASAHSVVKEVKTSYNNPLPGLPYAELPVISLINPSLGISFLTSIMPLLESQESVASPVDQVHCLVIHLYPADFPNIMVGMKSIIAGFMDNTDLERGNHKPATSLANYDVKLLAAWHKALVKTSGTPSNLVIVLHDFEQFDPAVMQDVFHIFSAHVKELPVVFLLSMSSPSTNYLNDTYSRATMALLRVRKFAPPSGSTFFCPTFEPDIMVGPIVLEYIQDHFTRYNSFADAILTILQVSLTSYTEVYPLAVLVHDTPSLDILSDPGSSEFVNSLAIRLKLPFANANHENTRQKPFTPAEIRTITKKLHNARKNYHSRYNGIRMAFTLMVHIQTYLEDQGYKGLDWSGDRKPGSEPKWTNLFKPMLNVMHGDVQPYIKSLSLIVRKSKRKELQDLLQILHSFFEANSEVEDISKDRTKVVSWKTGLRSVGNDTGSLSEIAVPFSEWLTEYLSSRLRPLEDCELWDVWYTGHTPFSSELLNPSIRASMMSGLLRPHDFAVDFSIPLKEPPPEKAIWELPDTSILFKRYLDSGRMINVYDWFESFKTVLDTQREKIQDLQVQEPATPKKRRGQKSKMQPVEKQETPKAMTAEEEEKWNLEVQARFVRALHELDYLGFIKHTGRKADHVLRTYFDVGDAE
ncbi:Origin recognition complex subunit 3 [Psilocybe cubensis]|uniref:Origin recognition complex subunit 3 n=2 Tax=Psilocybe cubensis TaxID=181762 RepID=A0ACB8H9R7_PSICU|nr:Origin recognition complex subunit 3 [Psilocybe cubensis]KAH9484392.1 Origin recognition complex subunit 3 [Psilocybe cubensis]